MSERGDQETQANGGAPMAAKLSFPPVSSSANDNNSAAAQQVLPASAPASSLLPPIPANSPSVQSQLLAMLNPAAAIAATKPMASLAFNPAAAQMMGNAQLVVSQQQQQQQIPVTATALTAPNMHGWSQPQLEQHIQLLQKLGQPVPQNLAILLTDVRKREEKKHAKRLANRKSASTSRARKKALVKEMTELNTRLRRQALILSLLPDLVMVLDTEGTISFCGAQVERVLLYNPEDLVGQKLANLLLPSSRPKLDGLIADLLCSEGKETAIEKGAKRQREDQGEKPSKKSKTGSDCPSRGNAEASVAAVVSEPSFPMAVVNLGVGTGRGPSEDNSDLSASNGQSKPADSGSLTRSPTASSLGNSGSNSSSNSGSDDGPRKNKSKEKNVTASSNQGRKKDTSSETSNSSSLSANAKQLQKANVNLERNVRWHNKKLKAASKKKRREYKDDVVGDDVTANNASARLSSLRLLPESEDDSGYRESNDSREESSSSASDLTSTNGRLKPLAPTCNICLVREDQTMVWCEVTSSLRTTEPELDLVVMADDETRSRKNASSTKSMTLSDTVDSNDGESPRKEILLCLRPIRDGGKRRNEPVLETDNKKIVSDNTSSDSNGKNSADEKKTPTDSSGKSEENDGSSAEKKSASSDNNEQSSS